MLKKNDIITVEITDINHMGLGVCRHNGEVVFVQGGVTGDVLSVKIIKKAAKYCVARIEKLITASKYRKEPSCPHFKRCGGCVYDHIEDEYELELKGERVRNEFKRFGITDVNIKKVISANTSRYRNKLQCPVSYYEGIGFYANHTHHIVPISSCQLQEGILSPIFEFLSGYIKEHPIKELKHIYLRCGKNTGEVMVCFVCKKKSFFGEKALADKLTELFPCIRSVILNYNPEETNVVLGKECRTIVGNDVITDILCGIKFEIHPLSFYQVNHDCTELLYRTASRMANLQPSETLLDLYCGIGTVGMCINALTPVKKLVGVEIVPEAVENAKRNAELNGVTNAEFYCCPAEDMKFGYSDVIVIDPPRKGCEPELLKRIGEVAPNRIVYISCSPDTLARDCKMLMEYGYEIKDVQPVNMFPRTGHVESLVCLQKQTD